MPGETRRHLPVLVLAAFAVAMLAPLLFGGEIFFFRDFGRFYRPVKSVYLDRLLSGEFPIWMPEVNCGTAIHGELVHGFLYPGNLLLLAGQTFGWGLFFAAHLVLAGLSTRALARRLGATEEGALLAGLAFAGSGYLVGQMNQVPYLTAAAWSPLVVLLGLRVADGRRRALPWLAVAFAMAALAGEPLTLLLTIAFLGVLLLAGVGGGRRLPALGAIGLAGVIALLLASPVLLPARETLGESVRGSGYQVEIGSFGSIHPVRLTTLFAPEACGRPQVAPALDYEILGSTFSIDPPLGLGLHMGAVTLVLLLTAPWRASRAARWLGGTAAVALVLSLGTWVGLSTLVSEYVPGMSVFRYPHKYWLLLTLAACLLAGLGAGRTGRGTTIAATAGALAAVAAGALVGNVGAGLAGAVPFGLAAAATRAPEHLRVRLLTGILAAELLVFGVRMNPSEVPAEVSPANGIGPALAARAPERIFTEFLFPLGVLDRKAAELEPPLDRALRSLVGIPEGFSYSIGYDPTDPDWRNHAYLHSVNRAPDARRRFVFHRLLRLIGNTHSVTNVDLRRDPALRAVAEAPGGIRAYEYVNPLPRARLYGSTAVVPDYRAAQDLLADLRFDAERILVLEGDFEPETRGSQLGSVRIVEDRPRRVTIECRTPVPGWLFLADSNAPGWTATVNGAPVEIRDAFIAFRAVPVPRGESRVEFRYEPEWLRAAPLAFGLGAILLAGLFVYVRRRERPESPSTVP